MVRIPLCLGARPVEIVAVSARDKNGKRDIAVDGIAWQDDAVTMSGVGQSSTWSRN